MEKKSPFTNKYLDTYRHRVRLIRVRLLKYRLIFRFSGDISSQYKVVLVSFPEDFEQNF